MHTESEARKLWCPMVRFVIGPQDRTWQGSGYTNRCEVLNTDKVNCIASSCAMFRFLPDATKTLKNGMVVLVDEDDSDVLEAGGWWWGGRYVKNETTYLHRAIIIKHYGDIPRGFVIDHRDGNPLNNRRGNLRICTQRENTLNSNGRGGKSKFKGVFQSKNGRWSAQMTRYGIRKCLGTYDTEEEAAKAYDKEVLRYMDEYSRINFSSPPDEGRRGYCGLAGVPK